MFADPIDKKHVITITKTMLVSIDHAIKSKSSVVHQNNLIGLSFFTDKALGMANSELDKLFEKSKSNMIKFTNAPNRQQWLFGSPYLLKEFIDFLNFIGHSSTDYLYLAPESLADPHSLLLKPSEKNFNFSSIDENEALICLQ